MFRTAKCSYVFIFYETYIHTCEWQKLLLTLMSLIFTWYERATAGDPLLV